MKLRIFIVNDQSTLETLPTDTLSAAWLVDEETRWIDIEAATADELRETLAPLDLPPSILDACLATERSARFIARRDALYMEVPTHLGWDDTWKPYLSLLCLPTTIITIHRDTVHTINDIIDGLEEDAPLFGQNTAAILYHLLSAVGKKNLDAALDVRSQAETLAQQFDQDPDCIAPQQIAVLRRRISHYATVHDDHTYCAGVLRTVESDLLRFTEQSSYFKEQLQLAEVARQLIIGAQSRVADLQNMYDAVVQQRVEGRLRMLTILSAIFLPLTLISAIYGMNFNDLPGMGIPYGYIVVIGIMLATVLAMGLYLQLKGWFQ